MVTRLFREHPADATTAEAVLDVIRSRRSIGKVRQDLPPRAAIEEIIEAATWAPNHRLTQPWRFFVLAGAAREALGDAMARAEQAAARRDPERRPVNLDKLRLKPLRAPVVIAVAVDPVEAPNVVEIEEVCAGAAAVQNMLLAAHALGLAAMWRTGDAAFAPEVKAFFGLPERAHLLGFVYVGYPDTAPPQRERIPAPRLTSWLGWDGQEA